MAFKHVIIIAENDRDFKVPTDDFFSKFIKENLPFMLSMKGRQ